MKTLRQVQSLPQSKRMWEHWRNAEKNLKAAYLEYGSRSAHWLEAFEEARFAFKSAEKMDQELRWR